MLEEEKRTMVEEIRLLNEESNKVDTLKAELDPLKHERMMLKTELADVEFRMKDMNKRHDRVIDRLNERENTISHITEQHEISDSKLRIMVYEISQYKSYYETIKHMTHSLDVENSMKQNHKRRSVFSAIINDAKKFKMYDKSSSSDVLLKSLSHLSDPIPSIQIFRSL